jgi:hypothetical protein
LHGLHVCRAWWCVCMVTAPSIIMTRPWPPDRGVYQNTVSVSSSLCVLHSSCCSFFPHDHFNLHVGYVVPVSAASSHRMKLNTNQIPFPQQTDNHNRLITPWASLPPALPTRWFALAAGECVRFLIACRSFCAIATIVFTQEPN